MLKSRTNVRSVNDRKLRERSLTGINDPRFLSYTVYNVGYQSGTNYRFDLNGGGSAITVNASGEELQYQWQWSYKSTCPSSYAYDIDSGWTNLSGYTSASLEFNTLNTDTTPTGLSNKNYTNGMYRCKISNRLGDVYGDWLRIGTIEFTDCGCTCPGGYNCTEDCCCYDCDNNGITCCDDGGTPQTCCRAFCDEGDPGYACGETCTCPGGETCDTCETSYDSLQTC